MGVWEAAVKIVDQTDDISRCWIHRSRRVGAMVDRYGLFLVAWANVCRPRRKHLLRYYGPRHPMYDFVLRISLLGISNFTRTNLP